MATHVLSISTNLKEIDMHIPVIQCHFNLIHPKGSTKKDHCSTTEKVLLVPGTQDWCRLTFPKGPSQAWGLELCWSIYWKSQLEGRASEVPLFLLCHMSFLHILSLKEDFEIN